MYFLKICYHLLKLIFQHVRLKEEAYRWVISKHEFPTYLSLIATAREDFENNNISPKDPWRDKEQILDTHLNLYLRMRVKCADAITCMSKHTV